MSNTTRIVEIDGELQVTVDYDATSGPVAGMVLVGGVIDRDRERREAVTFRRLDNPGLADIPNEATEIRLETSDYPDLAALVALAETELAAARNLVEDLAAGLVPLAIEMDIDHDRTTEVRLEFLVPNEWPFRDAVEAAAIRRYDVERFKGIGHPVLREINRETWPQEPFPPAGSSGAYRFFGAAVIRILALVDEAPPERP